VKDASQVLREKERELTRLRTEVEALHQVIPLLVEDHDWLEHGLAPPSARYLATGTNGMPRAGRS